MKLSFLEEPELQFGVGTHIDIRFGIMNYGPLDFDQSEAPKEIKLGIVGSMESIEGVRQWLERCRTEIPAKPNKNDPSKLNKQPNLFTRFPGFTPDTAFQSKLVMDDAFCRDISNASIAEVAKHCDKKERIRHSVELFIEEIGHLSQNHPAIQVIICALPFELLEVMEAEEEADEDEAEGSIPDITGPQLDFHDMLKAWAMQQYHKPIQIIRPETYDRSKSRRSLKLGRRRELQDDATIAWNVHTALYYKASGVPWRLPKESTELTVCYVGVSFYKSLEKDALLTSVAQVFNERGQGVVVRGGTAIMSKDDRQPHLPEQNAYELMRDALKRYRDVHGTAPARVVVHKSSRFESSEELGFCAALRERDISRHDFLWITASSTKLYRAGKYPPLRGTLLTLDDREMVLYTRGSVDFFETYPGKYVPIPLRIRSENNEQTQQFLAREILALSKMNWNHTQFDGSEPVTLEASRKCSNVLRYCSEGRQIEPRYSFYM
jgi:hypothetical protein